MAQERPQARGRPPGDWRKRWGKRLARRRRRLRAFLNERRNRWRNARRWGRAGLSSVTDNIRHFTRPGTAFELSDERTLDGRKARARAIAFYLPQFHAFEENDRWWGTGFTEWRNVTRAAPRFVGHQQPRLPRDLGFYDLGDTRVMREQVRLARHAGIDAFCFYYYWFDGRRLMDRPLDRFLETDIEQEFCLMWANENWTRTWDGLDQDVLIQQTYRREDEDAFIEDTLRYLAHPRYVRVAGRPLFILYRPGLLPDAPATLQRWRDKWQASLDVAPWILMVQGFGEHDPRPYGLDGAVEFPPHKICQDVPDINASLDILDPKFTGRVRDYAEVIRHALSEPAPEFPLIKTVCPSWDNDARREGRGMTLHGSTPARYRRWLDGAIAHARSRPFADEPLVFINAWNEWAEGAYLEPDVYHGHAYLNATRASLYGLLNQAGSKRLLLVGHDAHRHGAQMLLLHLARCFRDRFDLDIAIVLKSGGALLPAYRAAGRTVVLEENGPAALDDLLTSFEAGSALCNTTVTGDLVAPLRQHGLPVVSLVHELPGLIDEYGLHDALDTIARDATHVVFASTLVRDGFTRLARQLDASVHVRPQGSYTPIRIDAEAGRAIRASLGVADAGKLVMNVGYADLRKGFDRFIETALRVCQSRADVHFLWVGALDADMRRWVLGDLDKGLDAGRIHVIGFAESMHAYYSAADCLYLSSREDPYPTVVLEALHAGLPVITHRGATGFDAVMDRFGESVGRDDIRALDAALDRALDHDDAASRQARTDYVDTACRLEDYARYLIDLLGLDPAGLER